MGSLLGTAPPGLDVLAARCATWSEGIATARTPQVAASGQDSAAAVSAIHARVVMEAETFAGRMAATRSKLTTAARSFTSQDEESAARISSVVEVI